jgi:hypothetical protein
MNDLTEKTEMNVDYWRCGMCGVQLMTPDQNNAGKFPATRRFRESNETGLIAVRCAQCARLPYLLEEGQPHRIDLIGHDDINVIPSCNSEYNYYPLGIGHILEIFASDPNEQWMTDVRNDSIEIGFLVEENVNLIVLAYRRGEHRLNVTPYSWHAQIESIRAATPPLHPSSESDRRFTVAYVNTRGGKYIAIREGTLTEEFASQFHSTIHEHIARGAPDWERYRWRVEGLHNLLYQDKVNSLLIARCFLQRG